MSTWSTNISKNECWFKPTNKVFTSVTEFIFLYTLILRVWLFTKRFSCGISNCIGCKQCCILITFTGNTLIELGIFVNLCDKSGYSLQNIRTQSSYVLVHNISGEAQHRIFQLYLYLHYLSTWPVGIGGKDSSWDIIWVSTSSKFAIFENKTTNKYFKS